MAFQINRRSECNYQSIHLVPSCVIDLSIFTEKYVWGLNSKIEDMLCIYLGEKFISIFLKNTSTNIWLKILDKDKFVIEIYPQVQQANIFIKRNSSGEELTYDLSSCQNKFDNQCEFYKEIYSSLPKKFRFIAQCHNRAVISLI